MISSAGVGSGLDVDSIVTQLMDIERRPLLNISTRQLSLQAEISAVGQLKGAMSAFQSAVSALGSEDLFRSFTAGSTDTDVVAVTAGATAGAGSHEINVTQLAQKHRLASAAFADSDTTAIGTGKLNIAVGADSFSVDIGSGNNTLAGIRDAINGSTNNQGVVASILNVDGGSRLVLTAKETGADNALTVTVTDDGDDDNIDSLDGLSRLVWDPAATPDPVLNMTELDAALDAEFTVDTFSVTRGSNTVDDVIEGLSLTLKSEAAATITVAESNSAAISAVQKVSDAYNTLRTTITQLGSTELEGDSLLRGIQAQLRNAFSANALGPNAAVGTAFEAGFTFNDEGVLSFKSATMVSQMNQDMDSLIAFFADEEQGFAARVGEIVDSYVSSTNGVLKQRTESLERADERLESRAQTIESQMLKVEDRIRTEFAALDVLVSNLQVTNNFLLQQLDSLPFATLGKD